MMNRRSNKRNVQNSMPPFKKTYNKNGIKMDSPRPARTVRRKDTDEE